MTSNAINYPDYDGTENCVGVEVSTFYLDYRSSSNRGDEGYLASFCNNCHIQAECAEYATKHEAHGYWGGLTPTDRQVARKKRGIMLVLPELKIDHGTRRTYTKQDDSYWSELSGY